jgi:hypothetical protein
MMIDDLQRGAVLLFVAYTVTMLGVGACMGIQIYRWRNKP